MQEVTPPKYVRNVLLSLSAHGFPSCIVGGCVRDMILGVQPNDWDVATSALPQQVIEIFPDSIPTGIKHGTVTVRSDGRFVEVTTFRTDGDYKDHRHPDNVSFVGDLNTDLSRRDFTINAMAITTDGILIDPFGGAADLRKKIIRCVGTPGKRFEEDALRMLRAFRFSSRLGFEIEDNTYQAILSNAPLAAGLSAERVRDEVEKILLTSCPEELFRVISCGLLDSYLQKHLSREDALILISAVADKALPRWAMLCHVLLADDCISDVLAFLTSLRLDGHTIRCCAEACAILKNPPPDGKTAWKKLLRRCGVDAAECAAACWDAIYQRSVADELKKVVNSGECFSLRRLAVNGNDIASLGLRGRELGEMLEFLLDYVIEYPDNNRRELLMTLASRSED